jgi:hypothetical protein
MSVDTNDTRRNFARGGGLTMSVSDIVAITGINGYAPFTNDYDPEFRGRYELYITAECPYIVDVDGWEIAAVSYSVMIKRWVEVHQLAEKTATAFCGSLWHDSEMTLRFYFRNSTDAFMFKLSL